MPLCDRVQEAGFDMGRSVGLMVSERKGKDSSSNIYLTYLLRILLWKKITWRARAIAVVAEYFTATMMKFVAELWRRGGDLPYPRTL